MKEVINVLGLPGKTIKNLLSLVEFLKINDVNLGMEKFNETGNYANGCGSVCCLIGHAFHQGIGLDVETREKNQKLYAKYDNVLSQPSNHGKPSTNLKHDHRYIAYNNDFIRAFYFDYSEDVFFSNLRSYEYVYVWDYLFASSLPNNKLLAIKRINHVLYSDYDVLFTDYRKVTTSYQYIG
jgi:hypothetical protein